MAFLSLVGSKAILAVCNFLLLACGFSLIIGGMLLLFDIDRVLLSRLLSTGPLSTMPQPLLHYVAIGLACMGLILATTGILGCWASCMHSYTMLTIYFLVVIVMLVLECAVYIVAWGWPSCLGLGIDSVDLIKSLQKNYGSVGQEQFTAAVDLAQTLFHCCGVESANEYDTAHWRIQAYLRPSLAVPLTCCKLENDGHPKAYLDPKPVNTSLCQALEISRHEGYRHFEGCAEPIQQWYKEHYLVFLGIGLTAVLVEFLVLLSTILTCTRLYKYNQDFKNDHVPSTRKMSERSGPSKIEDSEGPSPENTYSRCRRPYVENAYTNDAYTLTNSFRQNYKLVDRV